LTCTAAVPQAQLSRQAKSRQKQLLVHGASMRCRERFVNRSLQADGPVEDWDRGNAGT